VQGGSCVKPFTGPQRDGPSDAAVLKPMESAGVRGLAISNGFMAVSDPRESPEDHPEMGNAHIFALQLNYLQKGRVKPTSEISLLPILIP